MSLGAAFHGDICPKETWGRLLRESYGLRYRFFLGEASAGASSDETWLSEASEVGHKICEFAEFLGNSCGQLHRKFSISDNLNLEPKKMGICELGFGCLQFQQERGVFPCEK